MTTVSLTVLLSAAALAAQPRVELVSPTGPGRIPDSGSGESIVESSGRIVSADGRWVAFSSGAPNLISGQVDPLVTTDVFLYDRDSGETLLVSRAAGTETTAANGSSSNPAISADGRWVAFRSSAQDLVPGMVRGSGIDIFLFDRDTGLTRLVSRTPASATQGSNGPSALPQISADGRWVAYLSDARNLVMGQRNFNSGWDVFLYDRDTATTTLVSHASNLAMDTANGVSFSFRLSSEGRYIAFGCQGTNVVAGQTEGNNSDDVFLHDRTTGANVLVSRSSSSANTTANSSSSPGGISADGRYVAFSSEATNLVTGQTDTNFDRDVFLWDRTNGSIKLASHIPASATTTANDDSLDVRLSSDGRFVLFTSLATNLVGGQSDGNSGSDVFLYERTTGTVTLLSRNTVSSNTTGNGRSRFPEMSADGAFIVYLSEATDLVPSQTDMNGEEDLFLHNRILGTNTLMSARAGTLETADDESFSPFLSDDGAWIAFASPASDLVDGVVDTNASADVFLYERSAETSTLVSRRAADLPSSTPEGDSHAVPRPLPLSADGRWVVLLSSSRNLVVGQDDANGTGKDVFLRDRLLGTTTLVSRSNGSATRTADSESTAATLSADGRWVAFASTALDVVSGVADVNGHASDIFLFDRDMGSTTLVSHSVSSPLVTASAGSDSPVLSADGRYLAYRSLANDLVPGQVDPAIRFDVFLYDHVSGTTTLLSHVAGSPLTAADGISNAPFLAADGSSVAFTSTAGNLVAGQSDIPESMDVFAWDRATAFVSLVSHRSGSAVAAANGPSGSPSLSADGRQVAFSSAATDLVTGQADSNGVDDVFLHDRNTGETALASHAPGSPAATGNGASSSPYVSGDGATVVFLSAAIDLVAGVADSNGSLDAFAYGTATGAVSLVSHVAASPTTAGNAVTDQVVVGQQGLRVAFRSESTNLVEGQVEAGSTPDLFLHDLATGVTELVSRSLGDPSTAANGISEGPAVSGDGLTVAFSSRATDLVERDFNGKMDAFVYTTASPQMGADLGVAVVDSPDPVEAGDVLTYMVTVTNGGPGEASDIVVEVSLPAGATLRSADGMGWACASSGGTVSCSRPSLDPGTAPVLTIEVEAPVAEGTAELAVEVTSTTSDPSPGNDTALEETEVRDTRTGGFFTLAPCRILDTRTAPEGPLTSGVVRSVLLHGGCGVPDTAVAVTVNVTAIFPSGTGHLRLYPGDLPTPLVNTLSFSAGKVRANNAIAVLATDGAGTLNIYPEVAAGGTVDVAIDVSGYFE
ncbi:MAG TPA: hypothetical protein VN493_15375 [Thermoanaerobaculia bacterium]|nr:hypothetical protein [Thermoanaerobaculia bacterium]